MSKRTVPHAAAPDTRTRIIEAGRYLFWRDGYAATGLAQILERAGANSGSFYHFFESKDELLREVLQTYVDLLEPQVLRPAWTSTQDPIERILALLDGYRQRLLDSGCQYGCPIGRLALEIDGENAPANRLIAANFTAWKAAVEACLRAASIPRPEQTATFVLGVMEGAVMQARAYRRIEPFDTCIHQLRVYLDAVRLRARGKQAVSRRLRRLR